MWTVDDATSSLTVSSSNGLQRLDGEDVAALREPDSLYPDATLLEVLQSPLSSWWSVNRFSPSPIPRLTVWSWRRMRFGISLRTA